LVLHGDGPDLPVHELFYHPADALLDFVELELHGAPPRRATAHRYPMTPPCRRAAISVSSIPSSRSTAAVSTPSWGGGARRVGTRLKPTGKRPGRMWP